MGITVARLARSLVGNAWSVRNSSARLIARGSFPAALHSETAALLDGVQHLPQEHSVAARLAAKDRPRRWWRRRHMERSEDQSSIS